MKNDIVYALLRVYCWIFCLGPFVAFGRPGGPSAHLLRGPYLEKSSQHSITIRWLTDIFTDSKVQLGTSFGAYPISVDDPTADTQHIVTVSGLNPDTRYFYSIGSSSQVLEAGTDNFFVTAPPPTTSRTVRLAFFGDCGRNDLGYQTGTLNAYQMIYSASPADLMILVGDNAYNDGFYSDFQNNLFNVYGANIFKSLPIFPVPGNHDYDNLLANQISHQVPYYHLFDVPANGECGGVPSGDTGYYSYDRGPVHLVALDSYGLRDGGTTRLSDTTGVQATWLKNDLAANTLPWTIVYFHHSPYCMGGHNSDGESELINIRKNLTPILERYGVDLVILGHDHTYQRSYLLRGYKANSTAFNPLTDAASISNARYDGSPNSCPYITTQGQHNHGTVYTVTGSAGASVSPLQSGWPMPCMASSIDDGGMVIVEVQSNRLDGTFVEKNGVKSDHFTMMKGVNLNTTVNTFVGQPLTLTASWPWGGYNWTGGQTTNSITITPTTVGSSTYYVRDSLTPNNCLNDTFVVNATYNPLPLELLDLQGLYLDGQVAIRWTMNQQGINKGRFLLERSGDGLQFTSIGEVPVDEDSSGVVGYTFTDGSPVAGTDYYRLSLVDQDGRVTYSKVIAVTVTSSERLSIYVPTGQSRAGDVPFHIISDRGGRFELSVFDVSGKLIRWKRFEAAAGGNVHTVWLDAGVYIARLRRDDGAERAVKFTVGI